MHLRFRKFKTTKRRIVYKLVSLDDRAALVQEQKHCRLSIYRKLAKHFEEYINLEVK